MIVLLLSAALTTPPSICRITARRRNKTTRYGSKGLLWPISCNSKSRICQGKALRAAGGKRHHQAEENRHPGEAQALFVWRDNEEHRDDIERHYLKMLTQAKREVIIANAYFFLAIACSTQCVKPPAVA